MKMIAIAILGGLLMAAPAAAQNYYGYGVPQVAPAMPGGGFNPGASYNSGGYSQPYDPPVSAYGQWHGTTGAQDRAFLGACCGADMNAPPNVFSPDRIGR